MATTKTTNQANPTRQIILENFNTMTPWVGSYTPKSQFLSLVSNRLNSTYFRGDNLQYAALTAPWAAGANGILSASGGKIIQMIDDPAGVYDYFALDYAGYVYAVEGNVITAMGQGTAGTNSSCSIAAYNGKIVKTYSGTATISYATPGSSSWTNSGSYGAGGNNYTCKFSGYLYASGMGDNRIVQINSSFATSYAAGYGLTLPLNSNTIMMENYNEKYLVIATSPYPTISYNNNRLYLWDGVSHLYNYSIPVNGMIVGMRNIGGVIYVAAKNTLNSLSLYVLSGLTLKHIFTESNFPVSQLDASGNLLCKNILTNVLGNIGIIAINTSTGGATLYVYDPINKELFSLSNIGTNVNNLVCSSRVNSSNQSIFISSGLGTYVVDYTKNGNPGFSTNSIELNGTVNNIEIIYDSPPLRVGDEIDLFLYWNTESDNNAGFYNELTLSPITYLNYTTGKYTIVDTQGINCKYFYLRLTTQLNTGTGTQWVPIIRKVIINYTPSNLT